MKEVEDNRQRVRLQGTVVLGKGETWTLTKGNDRQGWRTGDVGKTLRFNHDERINLIIVYFNQKIQFTKFFYYMIIQKLILLVIDNKFL